MNTQKKIALVISAVVCIPAYLVYKKFFSKSKSYADPYDPWRGISQF
mgnify:CR=1 FL=1|jgi:hypothetical protein